MVILIFPFMLLFVLVVDQVDPLPDTVNSGLSLLSLFYVTCTYSDTHVL